MRKHDTLTIAEFGNFIIEANYDYRLEVPYSNKHGPAEVSDIRIDKIELQIKRHTIRLNRETKERINITYLIRTIALLDLPTWLWKLLNDPEVLEELDRDFDQDEPDRDPEPVVLADDERDY